MRAGRSLSSLLKLAATATLMLSTTAAGGGTAGPGSSPPKITELTIPGWVLSATQARGPVSGAGAGSSETRVYLLVAKADPDNAKEELEDLSRSRGNPFGRGFNLTVGSGGMDFKEIRDRFESGSRWKPDSRTTLLALDSRGGRLKTLREDLPSDVMAIEAADLDGDGADEILLVRPGRIDLLPPVASALDRPLIVDPDIDPSGAIPRHRHPVVLAASPEGLWIAGTGALRRYAPGGAGTPWTLVESLSLARHVTSSGSELRVWNFEPRRIEERGTGRLMLTVAPEAPGKTRLHWLTLSPEGPGPHRWQESWFRFTHPQTLLAAIPFFLDGRPALAAWTMRSDRISLFAKPPMWVFRQQQDRTRSGKQAAVKIVSSKLERRQAHPVSMDLTGNGRDDLLLIYRDGSKQRFDVFTANKDGGFRDKPGATRFPLEKEESLRALTFTRRPDPSGEPSRGEVDGLLMLTTRRAIECPVSLSPPKGKRLFEARACRKTRLDLWEKEKKPSHVSYHWLKQKDRRFPDCLIAGYEKTGRTLLRLLSFEEDQPE